jgi:acetyltransferase-like isoleucine patch superfamily enzyme
VADTAAIGEGTKVWAFAQIGDRAVVGKNCIVGNGAYIDRDVHIGDNVKVHNKALLYRPLVVEDNCFIGPGVCFTNDKHPRFDTTRDLRGISWRVGKGASIGANATILPDVEIGENAVVGAGSVVTRSVPPGAVVCGNPARMLRRNDAGNAG